MRITVTWSLTEQRVRDVDESGVRLPERDLAVTARTSVSWLTTLESTDVRPILRSTVPRVRADRHRGAGDHELDRLPLEVVDGVDVGRVRLRNDEREPVRGERDRLVDEPLP